MTYSPEDFESIEEVRAKLAELQNAVSAVRLEVDGHAWRMTIDGLIQLMRDRDDMERVLRYWEDSAEAAQKVTREHYR